MIVVLAKGGTSGKHIQREEDVKSQGEEAIYQQEERPETDPSLTGPGKNQPYPDNTWNF